MSTLLEVIQEGEKEFKKEFIGNTMLDLFGHKGCPANLRKHITIQTLALLQAQHDELEGKKEDESSKETWFFETIWEVRAFNKAIQDQQDNLQALMKEITK